MEIDDTIQMLAKIRQSIDTKSMSSIARQTVVYALDYLQEVYASAEGNTNVVESERPTSLHESKND